MRTKFQSAEQSALHDIYHEQSGIAKEIIAQSDVDRKEDGKIHKLRQKAWENGGDAMQREIGYTSTEYMWTYWYSNIYDVINDLFVGVESLATKSSRKLNRELGLHKVNK
tara:strand:- start:42 stop:371 length:330 start_codon:yes stop_codon:yes gene_type:complete